MGATAQKSKIQFAEKKHDFGMIKEADGIVSHTFNFTNNGDAPLVINQVNVSCGCTTPVWSKKPIVPGGKGNIKVNFNPHRRPGLFNKSVRVITNSSTPNLTLYVSGRVQAKEKTPQEVYRRKVGPMGFRNNHLAITKIFKGQAVTDTLEFINFGEEDVTLGIKRCPSHITPSFEPATVKPNEKGYIILNYTTKDREMYGFVSDRVYMTINGEGNYQYSIGVSANIMEDFSHLSAADKATAPKAEFDETIFNFGEIKQGAKVDKIFHMKNTGKRELIVRRIRTTCGCTAAQPGKKVLAPGETTELKVTFNSRGKLGRQSKPVTIITNDPNNPIYTLRLSGTVKRE